MSNRKNGKSKASIKSSSRKTSARRQYHDDMKVKVLARENPFRDGSSRAKSFSRLKSGMTIAAILKSKIMKRNRLRMFARREVIAVA